MIISHLSYSSGNGGGVLPPVAPASEFETVIYNNYAYIRSINFANNPNTKITIPESFEIDGKTYATALDGTVFENANTNLGNCNELVIPFDLVFFWGAYTTKITEFHRQITTLRLKSLAYKEIGNGTPYFLGYSLPRNIQELELGVRTYTKIPSYLFQNVYSSKTMDVLNYIMEGNVINEIGECTFNNCTGLSENITFENVNAIQKEAFRNCTTLNSISFPKLTTITQDRIFYYCSNLENIDLGQCFNINVGSNMLTGIKLKHLYLRNTTTMCALTGSIPTTNLVAIHVPASMLEQYQNNANWSPYVNYLVGDL